MSSKEAFGFGVISGLCFGVLVITGQNIDPDSLMITVGDAISSAVKTGVSNPSPTMWDQMRPLILLISFLSTVGTIIYVIRQGVIAILAAIFGFLGIFFIIYSTKSIDFAYLGIALFLVGGIIARFG
jgi:hypothetical protein